MKKRGFLIGIILMIGLLSCEGQTRLEVTERGTFKVYMNGNFQKSFYKQSEAQNYASNSKLNFPDSLITFTAPNEFIIDIYGEPKVDTIKVPYPVEVIKEIKVPYPVEKEKEVDTILSHGFVKEIDMTKEPSITYVRTYDLGLISVDMDTILRGQKSFILERTKFFGGVAYKQIGTPFRIDTIFAEEFNPIDRFRIRTNDFCQAYFVFGTDPKNLNIYSNVEKSFTYKNHGINITDLKPLTTYYVQAGAISKKGERFATELIAYTTGAEGTEFRFKNIEIMTTESTRAKVRVWTSEHCSIQMEIGSDPFEMKVYPTDAGINSSNPSPGIYQHGRFYENLTPQTVYFYRVTMKNGSGKEIKSSIYSFKTL